MNWPHLNSSPLTRSLTASEGGITTTLQPLTSSSWNGSREDFPSGWHPLLRLWLELIQPTRESPQKECYSQNRLSMGASSRSGHIHHLFWVCFFKLINLPKGQISEPTWGRYFYCGLVQLTEESVFPLPVFPFLVFHSCFSFTQFSILQFFRWHDFPFIDFTSFIRLFTI